VDKRLESVENRVALWTSLLVCADIADLDVDVRGSRDGSST
jgi:hypothetical protein